ncbi:hypothetical protein [Aquabacter spiritensis]|uniref:Invasion protein IalB n=1 Tax=Aquabacter spiritensis TaxID=933073 RepID=A0A4R3M335_9HYPH|nr:hypothetical protein [Aquabacter spiritensis]TCT07580.1 hypothetical protein EDC64_10199 [Aquabacter spiritensis]
MPSVPALVFALPLLALVALFPPAGIGEAAPLKPRQRSEPPDPRVWSLVRGEDTFVLRFGIPRDPDPVFAATCQPSARLLQFAVEVDGRPFSSGDGVPLALSIGKRRLELAATAFLGASDGTLVVEAAVALDRRVFDLFRAGDVLTVKMPTATQTYPLATARGRLADFEAACFAR